MKCEIYFIWADYMYKTNFFFSLSNSAWWEIFLPLQTKEGKLYQVEEEVKPENVFVDCLGWPQEFGEL